MGSIAAHRDESWVLSNVWASKMQCEATTAKGERCKKVRKLCSAWMPKMQCEATTAKGERCKKVQKLSVHPDTYRLVCGLHYPAVPPPAEGRPGLLRDGGIPASGKYIGYGKQKQPEGDKIRLCGYCEYHGGEDGKGKDVPLYLKGVTVYEDSYNRELLTVAKRESLVCPECGFEHKHVGASIDVRFNSAGNMIVEGGFAPWETAYEDMPLTRRNRYAFTNTEKCRHCSTKWIVA